MTSAYLRAYEDENLYKDYVPSETEFDNTGRRPLYVPGFGGLAPDVERAPRERFAHGFDDWAQPRLTAREVTMLRVMNDVTDDSGWSTMLDDPDALARLRPVPYVAPLLSDAAWSWCVRELRDKAISFKETGYVSIFDSASSLVKSDSLIRPELLARLQDQLVPLVAETSSTQKELDKCIRLESDDLTVSTIERLVPSQQILRLVDPSLYCLTYGRTKVLSREGAVGLDTALESIGLGETAPRHQRRLTKLPELLDEIDDYENPLRPGNEAQLRRFSDRFQWLPCEVEFTGPPGSSAVRIASYVNNLHPIQHKALYQSIEEIISLSIKPWNEILVSTRHYQKPPRIQTFGVSWMPTYPEWAYDLESLDREKKRLTERSKTDDPLSDPETHAQFWQEYRTAEQHLEQFLTYPDPIFRESGLPKSSQYRQGPYRTLKWAFDLKYSGIKTHWLHPEPGTSFTYEDWKDGKAQKGVVPRKRWWRQGWSEIPTAHIPDPAKRTDKVSLSRTFHNQGLQVIVKVNSIELTPGQPCYDATGTDSRSFRTPILDCTKCNAEDLNKEYNENEGSGQWHLEGTLSEHIVATTLVCVSNENASPYGLTLQVEADLDNQSFHYEPGQFDELASTFEVWPPCGLGGWHEGVQRLQLLGRVDLPQGRLLTLPATIRRKLAEPIELLDKSRPGHVRVIEIHLVDPHFRLCSTRNVPPQQHHWWAGAGLDRIDWKDRGLPQELADKIREEVGDSWPMGSAEAGQLLGHRLTDELLARCAADAEVRLYDFDCGID